MKDNPQKQRKKQVFDKLRSKLNISLRQVEEEINLMKTGKETKGLQQKDSMNMNERKKQLEKALGRIKLAEELAFGRVSEDSSEK